jgi:hypothetical protein
MIVDVLDGIVEGSNAQDRVWLGRRAKVGDG